MKSLIQILLEDELAPQTKQKKKQLSQYNKIIMKQPKTAEFPEPRKVTVNADKRSDYEAKGYKYIEKKKPEVKKPPMKKTKSTKALPNRKEVIKAPPKKNEGTIMTKLIDKYLKQMIVEILNEEHQEYKISDTMRKFNFKFSKSEGVNDIYNSLVRPLNVRIVVCYNSKEKYNPIYFEYQIITPNTKRVTMRKGFKKLEDLEKYLQKTDY